MRPCMHINHSGSVALTVMNLEEFVTGAGLVDLSRVKRYRGPLPGCKERAYQ
jgi:hypothetical protein